METANTLLAQWSLICFLASDLCALNSGLKHNISYCCGSENPHETVLSGFDLTLEHRRIPVLRLKNTDPMS